MNVVIAIDSFKGSMTSMQAGLSAATGIKRVYKDAHITVRPLADGGEGTVDALVNGCDGRMTQVQVTGPSGHPVVCPYGIVDETHTAIIEMSGAAGITQVSGEEKNPLNTTTYGVGEVIKDAIQNGCRHFIVGIGGSATNDGGVGMLQALGFGFLDKNGNQIRFGAKGLEDLESITTDHVLPELKECTFRIACDVSNPLCGEQGCSAIYGPQKGATSTMILQMDKWLAYYAALAREQFPHADAKYPGAGAAGGLGAALLALGAELRSGVETVLDLIGFDERVRDVDLVITGEGNMDEQSAAGKAPVGMARRAKRYGKPVVAVVGGRAVNLDAVYEQGIDLVLPICRKPMPLDQALGAQEATTNLICAGEAAAQAYDLARL